MPGPCCSPIVAISRPAIGVIHAIQPLFNFVLARIPHPLRLLSRQGKARHKRTGEYASQEVTPGTTPNWHREIGEDEEDEAPWERDEQQWLAKEIASEAATQEMGNG